MVETKKIELCMEEFELVMKGLYLVGEQLKQMAEDMPCTAYGDPIGDERAVLVALRKRLFKPYSKLLDPEYYAGVVQR